MKTLLIVFAVIFTTSALYAQEGKQKNKKNEAMKEKAIPVAVTMEMGKVYDLRNDQKILVTTQIEINGTQINFDGSLTFKDGHKDVLKEGDYILVNGTVIREGDETLTDPKN